MTKTKKELFSLKKFNIILFSLIIICSIYYLININDLTVKGFKLEEFKKKLNYLSSENTDFEIKEMSLGSYNNLSKRAEELNMIAVGNVDYITIINTVAINK